MNFYFILTTYWFSPIKTTRLFFFCYVPRESSTLDLRRSPSGSSKVLGWKFL